MLEIKVLQKRYAISGEITTALDDVTISLPDKGLVLITGKNGSGKTTFLNMIGLLDTPDEGSIRFNGKEIVGLTGKNADRYRAENISFIFQTLNLVSTMTAKENLLLVGIDEPTAQETLQSIGLKECADKLPSKMSQGQVQKVAVQRAMLTDSSIILADEPTAALDKNSRDDVAKLLIKAAKNKLVLIITHDLQLFDSADAIISFENGRASVDSYLSDIQSVDENDIKNLAHNENPKAKLFGYKYLLGSAMRASRGKIVSTTIISLLLILLFVCINLFISTPFNFDKVYKSMAEYYESNNYKYVISQSIVEGAPHSSYISVKEFDKVRLNKSYYSDSDISVADSNLGKSNTDIPLYYQVESDPAYVIDSRALIQKVNGKMPEGKEEIVISDYYADLLIFYYGFASYQEIIDSAYLTLEFDGIDLNKVKVVGIAHTQKDKYNRLKDYYDKDIENFLIDGDITSDAEKDWVKFASLRKYSLACAYMREGFDDDVAKNLPYLKCNVDIQGALRGDMSFRRLSSLEDIDFSKDVYTLNDGNGVYIKLSDVVSENQIYQIIKDCTNENEKHNAILQFVKTIELSEIGLSNYYKQNFYKKDELISAPIVGFIDDIGKNMERSVFATDDFAELYIQNCINVYIEENPLKSYVMMTTAEEVYKMFKDEKIGGEFPITETIDNIGSTTVVIFYVSLIATCILLIFVLALIFNDFAYYFKGHTRDFAVLKALGASMRKLAFVSMMRYVFTMIAVVLISLIIAPVILSFVNSHIANPYVFIWLSFNPLALLLDIVLALSIIALAFVFQYRIMRKKSIGQLLKGV